ncbi:MAG: hypothetical protein J5662_06945, partial [Clostridia bacterium]|nr:hypothetical protein [Clostridia bacterium]
MKVKFMKKAISIVMSVCMLFSLLICFMAIPASADSSTMVVFDKSKEFSRVLYRPDTGAFEPGGKYLFSFDFDNLTANDESKCWGIFFRIAEDNYENPYFEEIPHDSYSIVKSELKNGLHYDVTFTVPTHCLAEDN